MSERAHVADTTFTLVSSSTTTGWLDWEHGELWLAPSGLLRRKLGWLVTFAGVGLEQDTHAATTDPPVQQRFTTEQVDAAVQGGGLWIPSDEIQTAHLRTGIMTGRLKLTLVNERHVKLLWGKSIVTYESLRQAVSNWLGDGLKLD